MHLRNTNINNLDAFHKKVLIPRGFFFSQINQMQIAYLIGSVELKISTTCLIITKEKFALTYIF